MKSLQVLLLLLVFLSLSSGCDFGTYGKRFKERDKATRLPATEDQRGWSDQMANLVSQIPNAIAGSTLLSRRR